MAAEPIVGAGPPALAGEAGADGAHLVKLATWLSPAFPVGGFAYSHGLEAAIAAGELTSAGALHAWLADVLEHGGGWSDAVLFMEAWRAVSAADWERLGDAAILAEALAPSRERCLESLALGTAFLVAVAAWPCAAVDRLTATTGGRAAYPVAVAAVTAGHAIPAAAALPLYLNAFLANLVSVAVRLVPLGQRAGLEVLAAMQPALLALAERALAASLDDLGAAAILSDIASLHHEVQESRVFRT